MVTPAIPVSLLSRGAAVVLLTAAYTRRTEKPDGSLYHEELMGEEGFSADSALLYHHNAPTAIVNSVTVDGPTSRRRPNLPLHVLERPERRPYGWASQHQEAARRVDIKG